MSTISKTGNGKSQHSPASAGQAERLSPGGGIRVGQWYWVSSDRREHRDPLQGPADKPKLMCVASIGSNHVELHGPRDRSGYAVCRVHFDDVWDVLQEEPNADVLIQEAISRHQRRVNGVLGHIKRLTASLGLPQQQLTHAPESEAENTGQSLAIMSSSLDVRGYQRRLKKAKHRILPKLFERMKNDNEALGMWMKASALSLQTEMDGIGQTLEAVEDRIFNVSLYAGLSEQVKKICDGAPADYDEPVSLFQRMVYMDEECLVNYRAGGMSFENINEFDAWLASPENLNRILPFARSAAAFRVRRKVKQRHASTLLQAFINFRLEQEDKFTFLYCRNGEQLYRIALEDFDFDEKLFPDTGGLLPNEPMMVVNTDRTGKSLMTLREFEARSIDQARDDALYEKWFQENPFENWKAARLKAAISEIEAEYQNDQGRDYLEAIERARSKNADLSKIVWRWENPYDTSHRRFNPLSYVPFDRSNLNFDDIMNAVRKQLGKFNRMALILQGLLDRSDVFHPHAPAQTWTAEGFRQAIRLIYDDDHVLHHGEAPNIAEYLARCNASFSTDSVFYGQQELWERKEAEKENDRRNRSYSYRESEYRPERIVPDGNPGPGLLARPERAMIRAGKVVFAWEREVVRYRSEAYGEKRRATFTAEVDKLFNVSAYQPGDYKRFFLDPRTRADYLAWAPMLLTAEDYHAGTRKLRD